MDSLDNKTGSYMLSLIFSFPLLFLSSAPLAPILHYD